MSDTPAPAPDGGGTPPAPAATGGEWTSGFNDEVKNYIQTKGFKGPEDVINSYRNFEKLQGVPQDRLLKLPETMDSPEGRAILERLGTPKDAKEYKIEIQKEFGDEKFVEGFRDTAFKMGLTGKQAETLAGWWNEMSKTNAEAFKQAEVQKSAEQEANLKTEWGAAFEQNINISRSAVASLGLNESQVDAIQSAIGYDGTMKLLHKLGTATGEAPFVGGRPANNVLPPDAAKSQINELIADQGFLQALNRGDIEAKNKWDNLHKMAWPGMGSL